MARRGPLVLARQQLHALLRPSRTTQSISAAAAAAASTRASSTPGSTSLLRRHRPLPLPTLAAPLSTAAPFSSSSSSSSTSQPPQPPITIARGHDRDAFEQLLKAKLDEPLGFLDEGTLSMWRGQEPHVRTLYYAAEGPDGELLGFLTVYEVERDPLGKHRKPHLLNLLYVQPKHRRRAVAVELVRRAAVELEVTALCTSEEYVKVCEKAGLQRGDAGALAPLVVMAS